jgi:hypothetical protein
MNKNIKGIALFSHLHPQFLHFLQSHIYIHTLKLTRWLGCHAIQPVDCSLLLRAMSEGSMTWMTKVGLAIADKSGLTR